ncbi:MAG TPA: nucleotidyltransferase family protein [bacterium]|nr:nucleotidyltransferase family protein [bacterium]
MSPAEHALLDLLRNGRPAAALPSGTWETILGLAQREGISAIVYARVRAGAPGPAVPESATATLARRYDEGAERTAKAYAELETVLRALGGAGVRAMLLKGAALARFTYEDAALRPFTDLDLLVRPDDVAAAARAMRGAGYAAAGPEHRTGTYEQCYFAPSWQRLPVDIHWRYAEPFHAIELNYGGMFARASLVRVGHEAALLPSPEDLLVALSVHVVREAWESKPILRYLCDAAETIRRHRVDWGRLVACARASRHLRAPLRLTLRAAEALLDVDVPAPVLESIRPRRGTRVDRLVQRRVFATVLRRPSPLEALVRIALMRWADGDAAPRYAALVGDRVHVQWARVRAYARRRAERARRLRQRLLAR